MYLVCWCVCNCLFLTHTPACISAWLAYTFAHMLTLAHTTRGRRKHQHVNTTRGRRKHQVHAMIFCHIHMCEMSNLLSCVGAPRSVPNNIPIYIYVCAYIYTHISTHAYSYVRTYMQVHITSTHICI